MIFNDLKVGQSARVVSYGAISHSFQTKLIALGLHKRARFTIVRKAPLGDPIQISVNNTSFSVRLTDMASLEVEVQS